MTPDDRFWTIEQIEARHADLGRVTLHGTPPGGWFQWWMDDVGVLLAALRGALRSRGDQAEASVATLTARVAALEEALGLVLPMARRHAAEHPVRANSACVEAATTVLARCRTCGGYRVVARDASDGYGTAWENVPCPTCAPEEPR